MSGELHIVGFQIGRETYGVPIQSLHEIVRVPEITAVPDAPEYLEGVINLRGKIVSVMDLRKRFGMKHTGIKKGNRILVVEHGGRLAGLIVDSASEVVKIPTADVEAPPAAFQEGGLNCVTGLGKVKGRLIVLLDIGSLLAPASLLQTSEQPETKNPGRTSPGSSSGSSPGSPGPSSISQARGAAGR